MNKTTYYINGNAVRELDEAAPDMIQKMITKM